MQITKDTRVSDILMEYGDIADVMEVFGVKRVGRYSLRIVIMKEVHAHSNLICLASGSSPGYSLILY